MGDRLGWRPRETAVAGPAALAVCRDFDRGEQSPQLARDAEGGVWAALCGELDNRLELGRSLVRRGTPPRNDAEIALRLCADDGPASTLRLQGLFALVLWDARAARLLLVADHSAGVRSLYFWHDATRLVFGTQAKVVLAHPAVPRALDLEALPELFTFGAPIAPRTLLSGVKVLLAGHTLECHRGCIRLHRTWRRSLIPARFDAVRAQASYIGKLRAAVERCAATDSPWAVLLSGGVDSAAVLALLRAAGVTPVRTYSIHVGPAESNESAEARRSADLFGCDHTPLTGLGPELLDPLPQIVWHTEWPAQDVHPMYWLGHRLKQDGIQLALGGYGNDLLWGVAPAAIDAPRWPRRRMAGWAVRQMMEFRRRTTADALRRLLCSADDFEGHLLENVRRFLPRANHPLNAFIGLDDALFGDQIVYRELGKLLVDAHGLEVRLPYHDHQVTALVDSLPPSEKLEVLPGGGWISKRLFRQVMRQFSILPEEVLVRRKTWIRSPTATWLRGELGKNIARLLTGALFRSREIAHDAEVRRLLREHAAGDQDWSFCLMTLAALEIWCRLFIDPAAIVAPQVTLGELAG